MNWRGAAGSCLLGAVALVALVAVPAGASHDDNELEVVVALNAAGDDEISVSDTTDTSSYTQLASAVAEALDQAPGSFQTSEGFSGGTIRPNDKLAKPDPEGGLSYTVDSGKLQLLAQRSGYDAVILVICTPRLRQVVDTLTTPQPAPYGSPGSRCRGWYQPPDEPALRAVVQLLPDRQRYPAAALRVAGVAAVTFGLLGLGATLLRRGPLRQRTVGSWLLSIGAALLVAPFGWAASSLLLWVRGIAADPVLLGGGSVSEQVARTLLPGLAFLAPALLPAVILLRAPVREVALAPPVPALPPVPSWWPTAWWQQWAAANPPVAPPTVSPEPPPPAAGPSGWARPGTPDG